MNKKSEQLRTTRREKAQLLLQVAQLQVCKLVKSVAVCTTLDRSHIQLLCKEVPAQVLYSQVQGSTSPARSSSRTSSPYRQLSPSSPRRSRLALSPAEALDRRALAMDDRLSKLRRTLNDKSRRKLAAAAARKTPVRRTEVTSFIETLGSH